VTRDGDRQGRDTQPRQRHPGGHLGRPSGHPPPPRTKGMPEGTPRNLGDTKGHLHLLTMMEADILVGQPLDVMTSRDPCDQWDTMTHLHLLNMMEVAILDGQQLDAMMSHEPYDQWDTLGTP